MPQKRSPKPKLTDAERHKRFLDAAKKAGASDNKKDFDAALEKIIRPSGKNPPPKQGAS